jgi:predicted enzyme related to lactoylglutathione lyase
LMTRDYEGAKTFYGDVFGYTYNEIGEGFTYSTVKRASDGEVVGGLGAFDASTPVDVPPSWAIYFLVEDCAALVAKAAELGADVVRQPFDTAFGRMATVTGPQGEVFSLIQPPPQDDNAGASSPA